MKLCAAHNCLLNSVFRDNERLTLSDPEISFTLYTRTDTVPAAYWELARNSGDYFLQREYQELLEAHAPDIKAVTYLLFFHGAQPVGIAYGQLIEFRADEHIRPAAGENSPWRKLLASRLRLGVLICGNMFLTGQHAFYFPPQYLHFSGAPLREALSRTAHYWRSRGLSVNTVLVKDLDESDLSVIANWGESDYHQLEFQPNMVLPVPEHWQRMSDYLEDLTSKYRVRYRRAKKKLKGVQCLELNAAQIRAYEPEIYRLYRQVADNSDFCVGYLSRHYFSEFKERAPQRFRLWGYFRAEKLIGFCTTIRNGGDLEAHFLGLGPDQQQHQLYLNMLYHLIETAIDQRADRLVFSRTAMEIKSSVGAVAIPTSVFLLHHTSHLVNRLVPCLVDWLEPKENWQARHPFREPLIQLC